MADKSASLSIIIRTVDKATAGIQSVNKRLDELTKPTRELGKAMSDLADKSGLNAVGSAFRGVGGAVMDLVGKVAMVGGVIGVAVAGVLSLVDHFDQLGDTAEKLGTSADFLAAFRFAAERAGAPLEGVDEALQTLVTNMGAAKSGTGKMLKFLEEHVGHVFSQQIVHANSLEEALGLLADGMAKLPDAARRSKLAMATLGNAALAPLLARGSAGVQELLTEFHGLAGGLGDATEAAGKTDDSMKRVHAAAEGVKAALVTGLAPALTTIINQMTAWFVAHRADIAKWADQIGKELPGAVAKAVDWIGKAYDKATAFIEKIGGIETVALAVAAAITGPLIASIIRLGIAMTSSPAGLVLAGLGALALGIHEVANRDDTGLGVTKFDTVTAQNPEIGFGEAMNKPSERHDVTIWEERRRLARPLPTVEYPMIPQQAGPAQQATVKLDFMNMPKWLRPTIDPRSTADVDLSVGHQMGGF